MPYYRLLEFMPDFVIAGNCFPAGHASGGLWLISLCVFWLPAEPKKAIPAGVAGLAVGLTMGISQQLRGAHFLSHTLWSIWFAAALILVLYLALHRAKEGGFKKINFGALPFSSGARPFFLRDGFCRFNITINQQT